MEGLAFGDGHIKEDEFNIITFMGEFYGLVTGVNLSMKFWRSSLEPVQIMKISSMYLFHMLMWSGA